MAAGSYRVYDLTDLTRGAAEARRTVLSGIEFKLRHAVIAGCGVAIGLIFALIFAPLLRDLTALWIPIWVVALLWFVEGRAGHGMELKNWANLKNKAINNTGKFFVSGEEYRPLENRFVTVVTRSVPLIDLKRQPRELPKLSDIRTLETASAAPTSKKPTSRTVRQAMASWADEERTRGVHI